jgi:homocysteine S-methyltransferase
MTVAATSLFVIGARISPTAEDPEREVADTKRKIAAGVDFLITPPVFDIEGLERLMDLAEVPASLPVLAGIMPLRDFKHAEYLQHEVPGVTLPQALLERMWTAHESATETGLEIARELIERARSSGRLRGVVLSSAPGGDVIELSGLVREATS